MKPKPEKIDLNVEQDGKTPLRELLEIIITKIDEIIDYLE